MEWDLSGVGRVFTVIRVCFWLTIIIASLWWRNGGNWTLKRKIVYAIALLFLTFVTILLYGGFWDLFGALILGLLIWLLLSRRRKIVYAIALLFLTFLTILLYDWPLWDLFGALILGLLIWFLLSRRGVKQGPTATPEKD